MDALAKDQQKLFVQLAISLTAETDLSLLLERILSGAMALCRADGGTLYTLDENNHLHFRVIKNRSLGLDQQNPDIPPVDLSSDNQLVVAESCRQGNVIRIDNAYQCRDYDFSGTRRYDQSFGYRTESVLCLPLQDHEQQIIGVLQLINSLDSSGRPQPFTDQQQSLVEALAFLAASTLTKQQLISAQQALFDALIKLLAQAVDLKSPVTSKHCQRVPEIAMLLAEALNRDEAGFAEVEFSDQQLQELKVAAWLHDFGKITTPDQVLNKATKLEALVDRMELVRARFDNYRQSLYIDYLKQAASVSGAQLAALQQSHADRVEALREDLAFLQRTNRGSGFLGEAELARIRDIAAIRWVGLAGGEERLLTDEEVGQLCIRRGTLSDEERSVMKAHVTATADMLSTLPYPRGLQRVPEIAGNHHEHVGGTGYPRGLKGDQLCLGSRILSIADVFEALTASDRQYKTGKPLSVTLNIMREMAAARQLDADLFDLFVRSGVYRVYANQHLLPEQIDIS